MNNNLALVEQEAQRQAEKLRGEVVEGPHEGPAPAGIQIGRQGDMVVIDLGKPMEYLALDLGGARKLLNVLRDVINGIEPVRRKAKR